MKDFMIVPVELKLEIDENAGVVLVKGFTSTYNNIDLGGDRVLPGFFTEDLQVNGNERPALWQHKSAEPVGVKLFTDTPEGLQFIASLPMDDDFVMKRVVPQIKIGSIQGASMGYRTDKANLNSADKCRDLIKGALIESSFVTFPMNPKAAIFSVSKHLQLYSAGQLKCEDSEISYLQQFAEMVGIESFKTKGVVQGFEFTSKAVPSYKDYPIASENTSWDKKKAVNQIREHTNSKEKPSRNYKNGFMYFDSTNANEFTAYKLPYVYYIDNGFKAVPRALSAIVGALSGARGGLNIPAADKAKVKAQLNKYYKKMGREEPFKGNNVFIDVQTLKEMEQRDIEKIFDENIILSTSAKQHIADLLCCQEIDDGKVKGKGDVDLFKELEELEKTL